MAPPRAGTRVALLHNTCNLFAVVRCVRLRRRNARRERSRSTWAGSFRMHEISRPERSLWARERVTVGRKLGRLSGR